MGEASLIEVFAKAGFATAMASLFIGLLQSYTNRRANMIADSRLLHEKNEANRKGDIEARDELRKELDRLHKIRENLEADREKKQDRLDKYREEVNSLHLLFQERMMLCARHGNFCMTREGLGKTDSANTQNVSARAEGAGKDGV